MPKIQDYTEAKICDGIVMNSVSNIDQSMNTRILIVDDEPYNILGFLMMMQQLGYGQTMSIIDRAYNGLEAVEKVETLYQQTGQSYGLIFMDLSMPFLDGYEATQRIREFYR